MSRPVGTKWREGQLGLKLPRVRQHRSPRSIIECFAGVKGAMAPELEAAMRREGFWGFADPKRNVLHFWVADRPPAAPVLQFFFGHELGHLVAERYRKISGRGGWNQELQADVFGWVAREADRLSLRALR